MSGCRLPGQVVDRDGFRTIPLSRLRPAALRDTTAVTAGGQRGIISDMLTWGKRSGGWLQKLFIARVVSMTI